MSGIEHPFNFKKLNQGVEGTIKGLGLLQRYIAENLSSISSGKNLLATADLNEKLEKIADDLRQMAIVGSTKK